MSGNGRVVVGWLAQPIAGTTVVQQGFFDSFFSFVTHDTGNRRVFAGYTVISTGYIASGRDTMCEKFLAGSDAEWLMMIDWDISFSPDAVYALLDAADPKKRPIISGAYATFFGEGATLRPCWMVKQGEQDYVPAEGIEVGKIIECTTVGMGFTLIHRSVLELMAKLYANDPWHFFGHDVINDSRVGEDMTFCSRARRIGFSVWGHGGVLLGHTKAKTFLISDIADERMALTPRALHLPPVEARRVLDVGGLDKATPLAGHETDERFILNIDAGPDVDFVMDARKLVGSEEVQSESMDVVHCSHTLEHFYDHEIPLVLAGFLRVLKPGGTLELRVPDMTWVFGQLAEGRSLDDQAYESPAGPVTFRDVIYGYGPEIERSGKDYFAHKTGFTRQKLMDALIDAEFVSVNVTVVDEAFELRAVAHKTLEG